MEHHNMLVSNHQTFMIKVMLSYDLLWFLLLLIRFFFFTMHVYLRISQPIAGAGHLTATGRPGFPSSPKHLHLDPGNTAAKFQPLGPVTLRIDHDWMLKVDRFSEVFICQCLVPFGM